MMQTKISRRHFFGASATAIGALWLASRTASAVQRSFEVVRTDEQWRRMLGPERYTILRQGGTERAGTSPLLKEHRNGVFTCAGCGLALFASSTKYETGTGWPSFYRPLSRAVVTRSDRSLGVLRTEVLCRRCGGHLGHVFEDGPPPTGLRYCMNGLALGFRPG